jgi:uncharacterized protein (DUF362 family)
LSVLSGVIGYQLNERRGIAVKSPVAIMPAKDYEGELADVIYRGTRATGLTVHGKRVLLKPNLVEFDPQRPINTDPRFVAAVVEVMKRLGAKEIKIGEAPGHRRDTWGVAEQAAYRKLIPGFDQMFVDMNRDDVAPVDAFNGSMKLYLPKTVLGADVVISLPKMKTHHWAGATLSMKNFFGIVPGCLYGWPKNILHYQGIDTSILELNRLVPNAYAIVDGIVGMEGNGPIQGTGISSGVIVMGADRVAVDATCCRLMGLNPARIGHIKQAQHLGYWEEDLIAQRGDNVQTHRKEFSMIDEFAHLRYS